MNTRLAQNQNSRATVQQEKNLKVWEFLNDLDGFRKFVMLRLRQFQLTDQYTPEDITNECFLRWHKAVGAGKSIPVLDGWMRLTAINIIRELSRKRLKSLSYEPIVLDELIASTQEEPENDNDQYQAVRQALQTLSPKNRALLELRFLQNMSWEEIANVYTSRGEKTTTLALRKRGQRALEALRREFLSILEDA